MNEGLEQAPITSSLGWHRHWTLASLVFLSMAAALCRTALNPVQEGLRRSFHVSDQLIALLQGPALVLPVLVVPLILGRWIDRVSRPRLLAGFSLVLLAGSIISSVAPTLDVLFVGRVLTGFAVAAFPPLTLSIAGNAFPASIRGRAVSFIGIGQYLGMAFAFGAAAVLLEYVPTGVPAWRWVMMWLAGPAILALPAIRLLPADQPVLVPTSAEAACAWPLIWRERRLIFSLMAGVVLAETAFGAALIWGAPALVRRFDVSAARAASTMAIALVASGIIGPLVGGWIADACERSRGTSRSIGATALLVFLSGPASLFALLPDFRSATVMVTIFTTLVSAACVVGTTAFTIAVPAGALGRCMVMFSALSVLVGAGLSPIAVTSVSSALGNLQVGYALGLVCSVLGAAAAGLLCLAMSTYRNSRSKELR